MDGETLSKSKKSDLSIDSPDRHKYYLGHLSHYVLLVIIFIFSIYALFQIENDIWKLALVSFLSLFYLIFGIWHHIEEKNLNTNHVLEYLVVSAIIFVVLYSLFL